MYETGGAGTAVAQEYFVRSIERPIIRRKVIADIARYSRVIAVNTKLAIFRAAEGTPDDA
jgi:hypothetical protein